MARLVTLTCPKCGANVHVEPGADRGTCSYCKTVSIMKTTQAMPAVGASHGGGIAAITVIGLVVAGCIGGVVFLFASRSSETPAPAALTVRAPEPALPPISPPDAEVAEEPAAPVAILRVVSGAPMFPVNVDETPQLELVVPIAVEVDDESTQHYAVFDARSGAERVRTPEITQLEQSVVAVAGDTVKRLLVSGHNGELLAYDLVSGDRQWSTALGDRVSAVCASDGDTVHVDTADARKLSIDLTTGRQSETRDPCRRVIARGEIRDDPSDRRDYTAPAGIEGWSCGQVRVMGSASFTVPDQCRVHAHVDTDRLDGMVGHRLWHVNDGWLVMGVRVPGRYVPRVGRIERNRLVWSADVPASNPLEAEEGGPRHVTLVNDTLVVGYEMEGSARTQMLTAFAIADGTRRWTVPVGSDHLRVTRIAATEDAVLVGLGEVIEIREIGDGAVRVRIGVPR